MCVGGGGGGGGGGGVRACVCSVCICMCVCGGGVLCVCSDLVWCVCVCGVANPVCSRSYSPTRVPHAHTSFLSQSPMLPSTLLKCLQAGTPLVITAVDTVELPENRLLMDMLQCRSSLHTARGGQKITVGWSDLCVCVLVSSLGMALCIHDNLVPGMRDLWPCPRNWERPEIERTLVLSHEWETPNNISL